MYSSVSKLTVNKIPKPDYDLIEIKGQGRFGYILEAYDREKDIRVAIKRTQILGLKLSREFETLDYLQGNEHIVKLIDVIYSVKEDKKMIQSLVFEYVPRDLCDYMKEFDKKHTHIPIEKIKSISKQILIGIDYCHQKGIMHRDIKPDNILVTNDEKIKICDFGSAKYITGKIKNSTPYSVTRYYRAPELILGKKNYDYKVDIFSIGCVICQLFIFEPMFKGKYEGTQIFEYMNVIGVPGKEFFQKFNMPKNFWKLLEGLKKLKVYDIEKIINKDGFYKEKDIKLAKDLILHMLEWDSEKRFSAVDCLQHDFFVPNKSEK